jgi:hypothetical protein
MCLAALPSLTTVSATVDGDCLRAAVASYAPLSFLTQVTKLEMATVKVVERWVRSLQLLRFVL